MMHACFKGVLPLLTILLLCQVHWLREWAGLQKPVPRWWWWQLNSSARAKCWLVVAPRLRQWLIIFMFSSDEGEGEGMWWSLKFVLRHLMLILLVAGDVCLALWC